jgi:hypothetical protein
MERMGDNGKLVLIKNMAGDIVHVPKKSVDVKMHKSQQF